MRIMKLADWIDGSIMPKHEGVYLRRYDRTHGNHNHFCAFLNGEWRCSARTPKAAMNEFISPYQNLPWRGLNGKP